MISLVQVPPVAPTVYASVPTGLILLPAPNETHNEDDILRVENDYGR